MSGKLYTGTSGWSYKHWTGIFYPAGLKSAKYLEYYATHFKCVELNSCFYHLPAAGTVKGWQKRTPDDFRFCLKLSRYITHQKNLTEIDEPFQRFTTLFKYMKEKLGPVLVQLPPQLQYNKELVYNFLMEIKKSSDCFRFAFEVRNKTWINDEFFSLLTDFKTAFVIADSGGRYPSYEIATTDFVYLRFHGREHLYASDYSDYELESFAEKTKQWLKEGKDVWAFFNNDFGGFAVKNAKKFRERVSK